MAPRITGPLASDGDTGTAVGWGVGRRIVPCGLLVVQWGLAANSHGMVG